jgi:hypothetical protein
MLSKNTPLKELVIEKCVIGHGALEIQGISDGLAQNKSLRVLDLSSNWLEPSAVQSLSVGLSHNTTLEYLNLAGDDRVNEIATDGAMAINSMLKANTCDGLTSVRPGSVQREAWL